MFMSHKIADQLQNSSLGVPCTNYQVILFSIGPRRYVQKYLDQIITHDHTNRFLYHWKYLLSADRQWYIFNAIFDGSNGGTKKEVLWDTCKLSH